MARNPLEKIQVLICDDEKLMNRLVHDILTHLGFRSITICNSGRKAIELLKAQSFDFIISDWRMKDLDGIDLLQFVRTSPESPCPHVPMILLTGNTETHYVLRARDAGVNEYLIKPFKADELVKRIRALIERPRAFVEAPNYKGPERRRRDVPLPDGNPDRRKHRPK